MRRARACIAAATLLVAFQSAQAEDKSAVVSWETLSKVSVTRQKDRYVPEFSKEIAALDKREVKLKGFMLPLETGLTQKRFLLLAQPPECGFCMPGGPEQIAEVLAKVPTKLPSDAIIVSGTFSLLRDDSGGLFYRLTEAVVVQVNDKGRGLK